LAQHYGLKLSPAWRYKKSSANINKIEGSYSNIFGLTIENILPWSDKESPKTTIDFGTLSFFTQLANTSISKNHTLCFIVYGEFNVHLILMRIFFFKQLLKFFHWLCTL
jgi:hypothetical protein